MELNANIPEWVFDGYGYGYGDGDGSGYGYGSGDGYGYGYGYGYGDGSGYGYGSWYWYHVAKTILGGLLNKSGILAFWRSGPNGEAANGGSRNEEVSVGLRQKTSGPLSICSNGFHATMKPEKWKGERLWIVALHGEYQQSDDKFCALEREILAEVKL